MKRRDLPRPAQRHELPCLQMQASPRAEQGSSNNASSMPRQRLDEPIDLLRRIVKVRRCAEPTLAQRDLDLPLFSQRLLQQLEVMLCRSETHDTAPRVILARAHNLVASIDQSWDQPIRQ